MAHWLDLIIWLWILRGQASFRIITINFIMWTRSRYLKSVKFWFNLCKKITCFALPYNLPTVFCIYMTHQNLEPDLSFEGLIINFESFYFRGWHFWGEGIKSKTFSSRLGLSFHCFWNFSELKGIHFQIKFSNVTNILCDSCFI